MRWGARTGIVAAVLAMGAALAVSAQTTSLRLVSTAWPPFTNEPGRPRFALDLVEAALGRIGISSTTTIVPPSDFTASLLSTRFDGSAAVWKDAERENVLLFSQPYLENRLILVGRRGSNVSAASLAALEGKRIAIVDGYSYGDAIEQSGPTFVRSRTEEENLRQLLDSAVDYALMDELVVRYVTSAYPKEAQSRLQFGTTPLVVRPLHLAIRKDIPDAASIISRFNAQIRSLITDRTYHRLLHVDWIRADVDGDGVPEYVPQSNRLGTSEPRTAYSLAVTEPPAVKVQTPNPQLRFYVGGTLYPDWASVPKWYKVPDPDRPDPSRSSASIFTFRW